MKSAYMVSTEYKTGLCMDATARSNSMFEMILSEIPPDVREEFKILVDEYMPPEDLAFLMDKKEIGIAFYQELEAGHIDIDIFVSDGRSSGGGNGWPDYTTEYYQRLRRDIMASALRLAARARRSRGRRSHHVHAAHRARPNP